MKISTCILGLVSFFAVNSAFAQVSGNLDIHVANGNISVNIRGSGDYVCSAQDSFKKRPRLGRGITQAEATANARYLAAQTNGNNDFFVDIISCEKSQSGKGNVSIAVEQGQVKISVEGPSAVQCIASDTMHKGMAPIVVMASTKTESSALAGDACTSSSNDDGFFCEVNCQTIAQPATVPGTGINVVIPKLRGLFGH